MRFAIYVRKNEETFDAVDSVPEQLRTRTLAVRSFDAEGMMAGWELAEGAKLVPMPIMLRADVGEADPIPQTPPPPPPPNSSKRKTAGPAAMKEVPCQCCGIWRSIVVAQMRTEGISVLLVEQNVRMSLEIADHAYVLDDGQVVYSGSAHELAADEARVHSLAGASAEEWTPQSS
jgi:hypothetical protein